MGEGGGAAGAGWEGDPVSIEEILLKDPIMLRPKPGTWEKLLSNYTHGCVCDQLGKKLLGIPISPIGKIMFGSQGAIFQGGYCPEHDKFQQGRFLGNMWDEDPEFMRLLDEGWKYAPIHIEYPQ